MGLLPMASAFLRNNTAHFFEYFLIKVKIISAGLNRPVLYLNLCWGYSLMTVVLFERIVHTFSLRPTQQQVQHQSWSLPNRI